MRGRILGWLVMVVALAAQAQAEEGVRFLAPQHGAVVQNPVWVRMAVEGMKVAPAGKLVPGTGHFHLLIDRGPIPEGEVIPKDEQHLHFGKGQSEARVSLPAGEHRLTLQFADGLHRSYGPRWAQTITVRVK